MSIVKKVMSVVMAIALVVTVLAVGASAAGTAKGNEYMTVTVSTNENYKADDIVTVSVSIKNNYNCTAFRFPVMFDSSIYELPVVLGVTAVGNCKNKGELKNNAINDGSFIPSAYEASDWGCILFQWTANVTAGEVGALNSEDGQVVFTFNLKVKGDAMVGNAGTIFVPAEYDGFYYQAIEDVADATTFYYLNETTLNKTFVAANPVIMGDPIVLSAKAGTTAVIDETNKRIYGLSAPILQTQQFDDFLTLTGTNATLQYEMAQYGFGTGTKVKVMLCGNLFTSYDVVLFGDANGDGYAADSFDFLEILNVVLSLSNFNDLQKFAMDIVGEDGTKGDGNIDAFDMLKVLNVSLSLAELSQVNPYQS